MTQLDFIRTLDSVENFLPSLFFQGTSGIPLSQTTHEHQETMPSTTQSMKDERSCNVGDSRAELEVEGNKTKTCIEQSEEHGIDARLAKLEARIDNIASDARLVDATFNDIAADISELAKANRDRDDLLRCIEADLEEEAAVCANLREGFDAIGADLRDIKEEMDQRERRKRRRISSCSEFSSWSEEEYECRGQVGDDIERPRKVARIVTPPSNKTRK